MIRHFATLLLLSIILGKVSGQTFSSQFNELADKKDKVGMEKLLGKWEQEAANDPELFVAYFNYFVRISKDETLALGSNPKGKNALQINNQDSSIKEPVGYFYSDTYYNPELLSQGFDWITKGIEKFPNRLDMRFGKIYMFGEIEDYENFTQEIIKTVEYSAINNNKWTWASNKLVDDPKEFMLSSVQTYQLQLYNTENDDLLEYMKKIAEAVLAIYPNHIESLSNLSIVYTLQKEFDKGLQQLLKAEKLDPTDDIVLSNIAHVYRLKGDKANAIKYYELTFKHGNENAKAFAKTQLDELRKKK